MLSSRRIKTLLAITAFAIFVLILYSSDARDTSKTDFYARTAAALEKSAVDKRLQAEADVKLESILKHAKELAGGKVVVEPPKIPTVQASEPEAKNVPPAPPGTVGSEVEEVSIAGRKKMPKPKPKWEVGKDEEPALNGGKLGTVEDEGLEETKAELNLILKKSPVIIFSKSYCPYSRRAKTLLLDTYKIVPAPYVVELDTLTNTITSSNSNSATLGSMLQSLLATSTGRKTVPNILVNGRSIGGSDELAKLDHDDELIKKIRDMGGRWVHEVSKRGT